MVIQRLYQNWSFPRQKSYLLLLLSLFCLTVLFLQKSPRPRNLSRRTFVDCCCNTLHARCPSCRPTNSVRSDQSGSSINGICCPSLGAHQRSPGKWPL